jgi:hypothetical protein
MDDLPKLSLTFGNPNEAKLLLDALENAREDVIWEARSLEDGTYMVSVLSAKTLTDKEEEEEPTDG